MEAEDMLERVEQLVQLARDARERDLELSFRSAPTAD
jgi:hypothetical protein